MADVNDLTQNVNIWDDAKSKSVTVTTDGSLERLDVASIAHVQVAIHNGNYYRLTQWDASMGNNDEMTILLKVPVNINCHFTFNITSSEEVWWYVYENPTITSDGTSITPVQLNRVSANMSSVNAYYTPTLSSNGTELLSGVIGSVGTAGLIVNLSELVLKESEDYYLQAISKDAGNRVFLTAGWIEESV